MNQISSSKFNWFSLGIWGLIMILLVTGFLNPLLRLPIMGVMRFDECHGFSVTSAVICVLGVGIGGMLWFLSRRPALTALSLGITGIGLLALLTCFLKLGSYLSKMLGTISTEGMDLSRVIQLGGGSLLLGLVIGLCAWFFALVQFTKTRTKLNKFHENL